MMKLTLRRIALITSLAVGGLGMVYPTMTFAYTATGQASNVSPADAALLDRVYTAFFNTPGLEPGDIKVTSDGNGKITLSGKVHNQAQVPLAEKVAAGVDGVTQVQNNLTVSLGATSN